MGASLSDIRVEYQALWIQVFVYFITACLVYRYQINTTRKRAFNQMQMVKEKAIAAKAKKLQEYEAKSVSQSNTENATN